MYSTVRQRWTCNVQLYCSILVQSVDLLLCTYLNLHTIIKQHLLYRSVSFVCLHGYYSCQILTLITSHWSLMDSEMCAIKSATAQWMCQWSLQILGIPWWWGILLVRRWQTIDLQKHRYYEHRHYETALSWCIVCLCGRYGSVHCGKSILISLVCVLGW